MFVIMRLIIITIIIVVLLLIITNKTRGRFDNKLLNITKRPGRHLADWAVRHHEVVHREVAEGDVTGR